MIHSPVDFEVLIPIAERLKSIASSAYHKNESFWNPWDAVTTHRVWHSCLSNTSYRILLFWNECIVTSWLHELQMLLYCKCKPKFSFILIHFVLWMVNYPLNNELFKLSRSSFHILTNSNIHYPPWRRWSRLS